MIRNLHFYSFIDEFVIYSFEVRAIVIGIVYALIVGSLFLGYFTNFIYRSVQLQFLIC